MNAYTIIFKVILEIHLKKVWINMCCLAKTLLIIMKTSVALSEKGIFFIGVKLKL